MATKRVTFNALCKALDRYAKSIEEYSWIGAKHPEDRPSIRQEHAEAREELLKLFKIVADPNRHNPRAAHISMMEELQQEWEQGRPYHLAAGDKEKGIRSSQISALVMLLIKKGVLQ